MNKKPRIAVIGAKGFPAWGGAARSNEAIYIRLKDHYDVTVYAISSHAAETNYQGIRQIIFKAKKNKKISVLMYYVKTLWHILFNGGYDLVHINHVSAGFIIPLLSIRFRTVLCVHGIPYTDIDNKWNRSEKLFFRLAQKLGSRFATAIISVNKRSIHELKQGTSKPVLFVPNGVDIINNGQFKTQDNDEVYDVTFAAARIIYLKGLHLALEALKNIEFKGKFQVIGDVDQISSYKNAIMDLSEGMNISFTGLIQDKTELFSKLKQSRLFVFPSYTEGMSNMLLEVASLKTPILASDIPANTDVFSNNEVQFFKSGISEDLQAKLKWALDNPSELSKKANLAYKKVLTDHNWDDIADQYSQIFQKLINGSPLH